MRTTRRRSGLTLIEVVVAVTLLAAGVAVVAESLTAAIRTSGHCEDRLAATAIAESLLARLEAGEIEISDAAGDVALDYPDALPWWSEESDGLPAAPLHAEEQAQQAALHHADRWSYEVEVSNTDQENLVAVVLSVRWQRRAKEHQIQLVRLWNQWPEAGR